MARKRLKFSSGAAAEAPAEREDPLIGQLRRGEIDLNQFYDAFVERMVNNCKVPMTPAVRELVSRHMREEVQSSPVLLEQLRQATAEVTPR